jgi:hypothetical protein
MPQCFSDHYFLFLFEQQTDLYDDDRFGDCYRNCRAR